MHHQVACGGAPGDQHSGASGVLAVVFIPTGGGCLDVRQRLEFELIHRLLIGDIIDDRVPPSDEVSADHRGIGVGRKVGELHATIV